MPDKGFLTIEADEAEELYRYMEHQYVNPNQWPAIGRLWPKLSQALKKQEQLLAATFTK
jgi:hypothetical protein